jgi:indole-3-glycerol phosphate synthase
MSGDLLAAVVAAARRSAEDRLRAGGLAALERAAAAHTPRPGTFRAALTAPGVRIIAECKRRSPSRGVLRRVYDPPAIARAYAEAGAAAISVLTEPTFFDGSLDHLRAVRQAVDLPLLRKDFVVTDAQVLEARAAGAEAVLLIVAALDDRDLARLVARARELDLEPLVEAHDAREVERAAAAGATVIGVNARNLRTLEVTRDAFAALAPALPRNTIAVAESGLASGRNVPALQALGYRAFLIGERLVTEPDPGGALRGLLAEAGAAA